MSNLKGFMPQEQGAPSDFGGRVLSNPDNIKPKLDTDPVEARDKIQGATMSIANPGPTDTKSFPEHPMLEHFRKPTSVRHPIGGKIPRTGIQ
jgi:hypothetical protein